jgi:hypothetical protein
MKIYCVPYNNNNGTTDDHRYFKKISINNIHYTVKNMYNVCIQRIVHNVWPHVFDVCMCVYHMCVPW